MAIQSLDYPLALDSYPANVDRTQDCLDLVSTDARFQASLVVQRGLPIAQPAMAEGFSPVAEMLRTYPQGTDHTSPARTRITEGMPVVTRAYVPGLMGEPLGPSAVFAVQARLFSLSGDPGARRDALASVTLKPGDVFRGRLVTGDRAWRRTGGYNFIHTWPGAALVGGGNSFMLEYEVTFSGQGQAHTTWVRNEIQVGSALGRKP